MKKLKKTFELHSTSLIIPLYNEELRLDRCFGVINKLLKKKKQTILRDYFC